MRKLNLGAGTDEAEGYLRVDIAGRPDVFCDARTLPFRDGTFEEVKAHHILEHIPRPDLIGVMNECHRVLGEGGILDIEVPIFPSDDAMADPTHVSFFVPRTFDYFRKDNPTRPLYGIQPWEISRRERLGHNSIVGVTLKKATLS